MLEAGAQVVLLAPALVVPAGGGADAAEVEAQGGQAPVRTGLGHAGDDGTVHVTAIEGMGMADDHAPPGPLRHREAGLQGLGTRPDGRRPLGYHGVAMRITAGGVTVQPTC